MNSNLLHNVEKFIYEYYEKNKTEHLVYHDILHTTDVVKSSEKIGIGTGLNSEEMEILLISAWFHDTGYTIDREKHESASAEIASSFLNVENYPQKNIEKVKSCILSTKYPQSPKNKVEEVLCDADLLACQRIDHCHGDNCEQVRHVLDTDLFRSVS